MAGAVWAGDPQRTALVQKAQVEFDQVRMAVVPQLSGALACQQSQAALLGTALPSETPLIRSRKGYCALIAATLTRQPADFLSAAKELEMAGIPALAAIARLQADSGTPADEKIAAELSNPACPGGWLSPADCGSIQQAARQWLGWLALKHDRLDEAASDLSSAGWGDWVAGRLAFGRRDYAEAVARYRRAVEQFEQRAAEPAPTFVDRLDPLPDLSAVLVDLGGAELLAGKSPGAIADLDRSIRLNPRHAWAYYLRARAKDALGQAEAALADYNLASRTAFAGPADEPSGEAHLYRGVLLYRRKDFERAENEFASALNFDIAPGLRADAEAWRNLAAVASGACSASRDQLQRSLQSASPYFPAREAQGAIAACAAGGAE